MWWWIDANLLIGCGRVSAGGDQAVVLEGWLDVVVCFRLLNGSFRRGLFFIYFVAIACWSSSTISSVEFSFVR